MSDSPPAYLHRLIIIDGVNILDHFRDPFAATRFGSDAPYEPAYLLYFVETLTLRGHNVRVFLPNRVIRKKSLFKDFNTLKNLLALDDYIIKSTSKNRREDLRRLLTGADTTGACVISNAFLYQEGELGELADKHVIPYLQVDSPAFDPRKLKERVVCQFELKLITEPADIVFPHDKDFQKVLLGSYIYPGEMRYAYSKRKRMMRALQARIYKEYYNKPLPTVNFAKSRK